MSDWNESNVAKESHRAVHAPAHHVVEVEVVIVVAAIEAEIEDAHRDDTDHHEEIEMMEHTNLGVDREMTMMMRQSSARDHAMIVQMIAIDKRIGHREIDHDHSAMIDVAMIDPAEMIVAAMIAVATIADRILLRYTICFYVSVAFRPIFLSFEKIAIFFRCSL